MFSVALSIVFSHTQTNIFHHISFSSEPKQRTGPGRKSNAEHAMNFYKYVLEMDENSESESESEYDEDGDDVDDEEGSDEESEDEDEDEDEEEDSEQNSDEEKEATGKRNDRNDADGGKKNLSEVNKAKDKGKSESGVNLEDHPESQATSSVGDVDKQTMFTERGANKSASSSETASKTTSGDDDIGKSGHETTSGNKDVDSVKKEASPKKASSDGATTDATEQEKTSTETKAGPEESKTVNEKAKGTNVASEESKEGSDKADQERTSKEKMKKEKRQRKKNGGSAKDGTGEDGVEDDEEVSRVSVVSMDSQEFLNQHNDVCEICNDGGDLLCCSTCNLVFHLKCTRPVLKQLPPGTYSPIFVRWWDCSSSAYCQFAIGFTRHAVQTHSSTCPFLVFLGWFILCSNLLRSTTTRPLELFVLYCIRRDRIQTGSSSPKTSSHCRPRNGTNETSKRCVQR